ncbi:hypothetical protein Q7P37_002389 [Cladosporium fusiforme]
MASLQLLRFAAASHSGIAPAMASRMLSEQTSKQALFGLSTPWKRQKASYLQRPSLLPRMGNGPGMKLLHTSEERITHSVGNSDAPSRGMRRNNDQVKARSSSAHCHATTSRCAASSEFNEVLRHFEGQLLLLKERTKERLLKMQQEQSLPGNSSRDVDMATPKTAIPPTMLGAEGGRLAFSQADDQPQRNMTTAHPRDLTQPGVDLPADVTQEPTTDTLHKLPNWLDEKALQVGRNVLENHRIENKRLSEATLRQQRMIERNQKELTKLRKGADRLRRMESSQEGRVGFGIILGLCTAGFFVWLLKESRSPATESPAPKLPAQKPANLTVDRQMIWRDESEKTEMSPGGSARWSGMSPSTRWISAIGIATGVLVAGALRYF